MFTETIKYDEENLWKGFLEGDDLTISDGVNNSTSILLEDLIF